MSNKLVYVVLGIQTGSHINYIFELSVVSSFHFIGLTYVSAVDDVLWEYSGDVQQHVGELRGRLIHRDGLLGPRHPRHPPAPLSL